MTGAVDVHTHLDHPDFDPDRAEVLARAHAAGVTGVVLCAADPGDWDRVQATGEALGVPWTLGLHPWWVTALSERQIGACLARLAARPTPHGLGETGLDHHRARDPAARDLQLRATADHLALAAERGVPVVLHCVRAWPDLAGLIRRVGLPAGGLVHAWTGDAAQAAQAVDLGLHVSFGAAATRSAKILQAAAAVPLDRLLLETDCPDQPVRPGTRGEPEDLLRVAAAIAAARRCDAAALLEATGRNARRLFPALG